MNNPTNIEYDDTQVVELPIEFGPQEIVLPEEMPLAIGTAKTISLTGYSCEDVTQTIPVMTMQEMRDSGPTTARVSSRELEVRPDIAVPRTVARKVNNVIRLPVRPRRVTQVFGSRGGSPAIKVG